MKESLNVNSLPRNPFEMFVYHTVKLSNIMMLLNREQNIIIELPHLHLYI